MALKLGPIERVQTVGHVSHDAQVRIDKRVAEILATRRRAARRVGRPQRLKGV